MPEMGRFKLGGFSYASECGIPLLPVVMHGCQEVWPYGAIAPTDGTVVVTTLPEVRADGADRDELRVIADSVRDGYIAEMARLKHAAV